MPHWTFFKKSDEKQVFFSWSGLTCPFTRWCSKVDMILVSYSDGYGFDLRRPRGLRYIAIAIGRLKNGIRVSRLLIRIIQYIGI